jgi:hypothetical protein
MTLLERIAVVREKAKTSIATAPELPILIQYLELAESIVQQGGRHPRSSHEERQKLIGGFGRIATDNMAFCDSELGQEMFDVMNAFAAVG